MNTRLEPLVNRHINLLFLPIEILVNSSRGIICLMTVRAHAKVIHPTHGKVPAILRSQYTLVLGVKTGQLLTVAGTPLTARVG